MSERTRLTTTLLAALMAMVGGIVMAASAGAQVGSTGEITGTATMGTASETLATGVTVELIELSEAGVTSQRTELGEDGRYTFTADVEPTTRYIPRVEYEGVQYLGAPVILDADASTVEVEPIVVYATTDAAPELTIQETVMTAIALDRTLGQIGFVREDVIANPSDRAFVGGNDRTTLRIPAPEATLDAAGENADGQFALVDGILTTTTPIHALGSTSIITRFLVEYDVTEDRYVLRVTVPVAADRITLRVPRGYVRDLRPQGAAVIGADEELETATGPVSLMTVVLTNARPGDSLVVELDGLAIRVNHNPLAEAPGAPIAAAGALAILTASVVGAVILRRRRQAAA